MEIIKQQSYPDPCEKCDKADSCTLGYGCADWQIRYRYRQKQVNAYARRDEITGKNRLIYITEDVINLEICKYGNKKVHKK